MTNKTDIWKGVTASVLPESEPNFITIMRVYTDRGSLPGHPPDLVGVRAQFVEAQGGGQRRERVVLEQAAALEAALPQSLVVLVQVLHGLAVGADPPVLVPAVLQGGRDARHAAASGAWSREPGRFGESWKGVRCVWRLQV